MIVNIAINFNGYTPSNDELDKKLYMHAQPEINQNYCCKWIERKAFRLEENKTSSTGMWNDSTK